MKHLSLTQQLVNSIRQKILSGVYPPGFQLRQDALAQEHGVSRIPVRESLLQLKAEGLVDIIPRKGALVNKISPIEIDDIFSLRTILEPRLFRASVEKLDQSIIDTAIDLNNQYQEAIRNKKVYLFADLDVKLHTTLYDCADMPKTKQIVHTLLQSSERYNLIRLCTNDVLLNYSNEHSELLDLTRKGYFKEAEELLISHLNNVWKHLKESIPS